VAWRGRRLRISEIVVRIFSCSLLTYIPLDTNGPKFVQWLCPLGQGLWKVRKQFRVRNRGSVW
jgi:hypothetical protein